MSDHHEASFHKFRPLCLTLLKAPSLDTLHKLQIKVEESESEELQNLQDHILFPLQVYLKEPTCALNYTIAVIDFIRLFCIKIQIKTFFILKDILNSLLSIASKNKSDHSSEDLKLSVVSCVAVIIKSSADNVINEFYSEGFKLPVSHLVFLTLEWAENEKSPLLKSSCVNLLDICLERRYAEFSRIFVGLLPGISSRLVKLCQDVTLHQASVKAAALNSWGAFVTALFCDNVVCGCDVDQGFVENAKLQLSIQFKALQGFSTHSEKRIRDTLFKVAENLMINCWNSLENCRYLILNIIIIQKETSPGNSCDASLDLFVQKSTDNKEELCLEVNNILHGLIKDLETGIGLYTEEKLLEKLTLLHGYISFLTKIEDVSTFFVSKIHVEMLMQNLVRLAQFEDLSSSSKAGVHEISLIHGSHRIFLINAIFSNTIIPLESKPVKQLRYLKSKNLESKFNSLCQLLGQMESFSLIVDYLTEEIQNLQFFKREVMLILNQVVLGSSFTDRLSADKCEAYLTLADVYMNIEFQPQALVKPGQKCENSNQFESWNEILLSIEGLGIIVKSNKAKVEHMMPNILYYMISNVSSTCAFSTAVLYFALCDVATGFGSTIPEILADNVGHLSRQLNLTLRQRNLSPPGIDTLLKLIINVSYLQQPNSSIPNDLIDSISSLTLNLSISEETHVLEILKLIFVIVEGFKQNYNKFEECKDDVKNDMDAGLITRMIANLEKEKKVEQDEMKKAEQSIDADGTNYNAKEDDNFEAVMDQQDEENKLEPNFDQTFLKICLDHVQHFVSMSAQPRWQLLALDIVTCCLDLLGTTPQESAGSRQETFLPLVHQIWSSLRLLFKSNNIFVVDKAFDCLLVIGQHARDFVHKRVVTDVVPAIVKFFATLDVLVKDRERTRTLAARESHRILEKMITGLWDLLALLDLNPLETDPLIHMIVQNLVDTTTGDSNQIRHKLRPKRSLDANILELKLNYLV